MPKNLPTIPDNDPSIWSDFLALCAFGGRLTGSSGEAAARDWAVEQLTAIGKGTLTREPTRYAGWKCLNSELALLNDETLESAPLLHSAATSAEGLELEVIDCGRGTLDELRAAGSQLKGELCWCGTNTCSREAQFIAGRN